MNKALLVVVMMVAGAGCPLRPGETRCVNYNGVVSCRTAPSEVEIQQVNNENQLRALEFAKYQHQLDLDKYNADLAVKLAKERYEATKRELEQAREPEALMIKMEEARRKAYFDNISLCALLRRDMLPEDYSKLPNCVNGGVKP